VLPSLKLNLVSSFSGGTFSQHVVKGSHCEIVDELDGTENAGPQEKSQHPAHGDHDIQSRANRLPPILIRWQEGHIQCDVEILVSGSSPIKFGKD